MYAICSHAWPKSRAAVRNSASAAFAAESRGIADSAEYASLFSPLIDTLSEEEEAAADQPGSGRLID
jgi:hypothetical protein